MTEREHIEELHQRYLTLRENTPMEKRNGEECKAYHNWYDSAYVYFKSFDSLEDDTDFKLFVNAGKDGNCFVLGHIYDTICPSYKFLMTKTGKLIQTDNNTEKNPHKVFISHNQQDKTFAKALVNLLLKLGIRKKDIFCSSYPGFGILMGEDFINTIRDQFYQFKLTVLFVHSPRFYTSHISLCEMGAAWIQGCKVFSFLTNDCEFSELTGVIKPSEVAFRAGQENTYHLLNDFFEYLKEEFSLEASISSWEEYKDEFIDTVKALTYDHILIDDSVKNKQYATVEPNNTRFRIIDFINSNHAVTKMQIASFLGVSDKTIDRVLKSLCQEGVIKASKNKTHTEYSLIEK